MGVFVINEWLWADLSGSNGREGQLRGFDVIEKLAKSDHQIVIIEGSAFDQKAWNLCGNNNPMVVRRMAGVYVASIRQNSDRCLILKPDVLAALPTHLVTTIKDDDHYLVRAQLGVPNAVLVTTDNDLREIVLRDGLSCLLRDEFIATYF
jgi:hypothetical protein